MILRFYCIICLRCLGESTMRTRRSILQIRCIIKRVMINSWSRGPRCGPLTSPRCSLRHTFEPNPTTVFFIYCTCVIKQIQTSTTCPEKITKCPNLFTESNPEMHFRKQCRANTEMHLQRKLQFCSNGNNPFYSPTVPKNPLHVVLTYQICLRTI